MKQKRRGDVEEETMSLSLTLDLVRGLPVTCPALPQGCLRLRYAHSAGLRRRFWADPEEEIHGDYLFFYSIQFNSIQFNSIQSTHSDSIPFNPVNSIHGDEYSTCTTRPSLLSLLLLLLSGGKCLCPLAGTRLSQHP